MANPKSWISHLETYVDSSRPSNQQDASLNAIAALVKSDRLTIEELVKEMELYLTTADNVLRARGILLLAGLLTHLMSKPLHSATVHSLIAFFSSRLADWQAIRGALIGCLALLRRESSVGMVVASDARMVAESYLQNLQVQSLAQHDRKLCFEVLECILDRHSDAVVSLGNDLVYGICEAIDEEKDPQCLILTFHIVEILVRLFPVPSGPIATYAGDLFDILGRYFPIYFTHPKNDELHITRDDLSRALMHAFSSTPFFEPFAVPLLLDKLSSSLSLAKVDSLNYLSNCILHYGADRIGKHVKAIWSSLKDVIFTPSPQEALASLASEMLGELKSPQNEVAKGALICLQTLMLQLDTSTGNMFLNLILEDEDLETIFRSVISKESFKDISSEGKQKLHAVGFVLSLSAKVSNACCNSVFQNIFPRLMDILGISLKSSLDCTSNGNVPAKRPSIGALYLSVELLAACRELVVSSEEISLQSPSRKDTWFGLLQNFSGSLVGVFASFVVASKGVDTEEANVYCVVKGLQTLAMFPASFTPLSKAMYEEILMIFMSVVTRRFEEKLLWKLALKALTQIGASNEKNHDSENGLSYMDIVVEKTVSLLSLGHSDVNLPLKLEAICDIGTTGLHFMLKVVHKLEEAIFTNLVEAFAKQNAESTQNLVPLLECYSGRVLPWFDKHEGFEEVAMRFVVNMWDHLDNCTTFNIGTKGQVLLDATMMTMMLAVAGCMLENQALIVQKAYSIISLRTFSSLKESLLLTTSRLEESETNQDLISLSCRDEWFVSLFASVIMALHPQTPIPDIRVLLKFLLNFALIKGHVPAAQALGSIVNKWPLKASMADESCSCTLEEALQAILELGSWSLLDSGPVRKYDNEDGSICIAKDLCATFHRSSLVQTHAIVGLAWIGKGLVMRGHERAWEIIMLLLKCLLLTGKRKATSLQQDPLGDCVGHDAFPLLAKSATDAFHVLLSDSEVCLNKKFHATVRPLYKQHFFSSMTPIILSLIKDSDSPITRVMLYRAFGHVISETPLVALVTEAKKIIPSLLNGLAVLSLDVANKDLTYSLLLVFSAILMDENGKEVILENAHAVIIHLIGLISYPHMMLVRETAIQCLIAMSALPYVTIYPMRTQVLRAISKALDDPKRPVRQEAARCCQAWTSTALRSLHF